MIQLIWFSISAIIIGIGCFREGKKGKDVEHETLISYFIVGLFWPVTLAMLLLSAPFYGLYKLGQVSKNIKI